VYGTLISRAAAALAAGQSVIVDAVWLKPDERAAIQAVAERAGAPFHGIWLSAPEAAMVARVTARTEDASDADASVVRFQQGLPAGDIAWTQVNADQVPAAVAQQVRDLLGMK